MDNSRKARALGTQFPQIAVMHQIIKHKNKVSSDVKRRAEGPGLLSVCPCT